MRAPSTKDVVDFSKPVVSEATIYAECHNCFRERACFVIEYDVGDMYEPMGMLEEHVCPDCIESY